MLKPEKLMEKAVLAAKNAYAPYSHFTVGAALESEDGKIFSGCNIENSSFSVTVCAERTALFKAVSEGRKSFAAIAVAGSSDGDFSKPCMPCGVCRQALAEFCKADMPVYLYDKSGEISTFLLGELLPEAFSL